MVFFMNLILRLLVFIVLFLTIVQSGFAKKLIKTELNNPADSVLYQTILLHDSLLFEAFNTREFQKFQSYFSPDLEIYQDNTGVRNFQLSMEAFYGLFTGNYILTRKLIKETLEVYPIKDFGAIETGQHTFCHDENGKPDCGTFRFVHIWKNENGIWKITRIITYGH